MDAQTKGGGGRVMERGREEREETKNRIGKKRRGGLRWAIGPRNCAWAGSIPRGENDNYGSFTMNGDNIREPCVPENGPTRRGE